MSVCHAASIVVDGECVAFFGPQDAHWRVPLDQIRALGEVRSAALEDGHYLAILVDGSGAWFQAPIRSTGMDQSLQRLGDRFCAPMTLKLAHATIDSSRVIWPQALVDQSIFEWDDRQRMAVRAEILRSIESTRQRPNR